MLTADLREPGDAWWVLSPLQLCMFRGVNRFQDGWRGLNVMLYWGSDWKGRGSNGAVVRVRGVRPAMLTSLAGLWEQLRTFRDAYKIYQQTPMRKEKHIHTHDHSVYRVLRHNTNTLRILLKKTHNEHMHTCTLTNTCTTTMKVNMLIHINTHVHTNTVNKDSPKPTYHPPQTYTHTPP